MRAALIVGINFYQHCSCLFGCVADAHAVLEVLERHGDGSPNFDCKVLTSIDESSILGRGSLKDRISELFGRESEVSLFYFAGHGHIDAAGGYLLTPEAKRGDDGLSLNEVLILANASRAKNKVVVLDSCHSGIAGAVPQQANLTTLAKGVTVLTASTAEQYASEEDGRGVFTSLLVDALKGSAASLTGDITPGSVYAHIDQQLNAWDQRPVFKTNVQEFVSLRKVIAPISREDLRHITSFFPVQSFEFSLDPTFEPEMKGRHESAPLPIEENTRRFEILQKYNRLNLLVPVGAPHMWYAAMNSKKCRLTQLGEHYRRLVEKGRI
jgi:hypothetical protein